jgi:hypothetical protein
VCSSNTSWFSNDIYAFCGDFKSLSRQWPSNYFQHLCVTRTNKSNYIFEGVMQYTFEWATAHIWMSHVALSDRYPANGPPTTSYTSVCHTYEWFTLHIWRSHVAHMNESRHTLEWVTSHFQIALSPTAFPLYPTLVCHTYEWVTLHVWRSHVTHMNEEHDTFERVTSPIQITLSPTAFPLPSTPVCVTHMNESCHTFAWVTSHIWMSHSTQLNESSRTFKSLSRQWSSHYFQ